MQTVVRSGVPIRKAYSNTGTNKSVLETRMTWALQQKLLHG